MAWVQHYVVGLGVDKFVLYDTDGTAWKYVSQLPRWVLRKVDYQGSFAARCGFGETLNLVGCHCMAELSAYNHCLHKAKHFSRWVMIVNGLDEWFSFGQPSSSLVQNVPISNFFLHFDQNRNNITTLLVPRYDHAMVETFAVLPVSDSNSNCSDLNDVGFSQLGLGSGDSDSNAKELLGLSGSQTRQWYRWFFDDVAVQSDGVVLPCFARAQIVNTDRAEHLTTHQTSSFYPEDEHVVMVEENSNVNWKIIHFLHMFRQRDAS